MAIELGTVNLKDIVTLLTFVFFLGGIWRDIRSTKRTVERHSKYLSNDRDVLIRLTTEHNKNHAACVQVPNMNGMTR